MKTKIRLSDLQFDLGELLNYKALLEDKIDREQKWVAENHTDLGANQLRLFKEMIADLQDRYKDNNVAIQRKKQQIEKYENRNLK